MIFKDRIDAGDLLARSLAKIPLNRPLIFGLPRGGVPVAFEISKSLAAPLDILIVRKLGVPWQPELAFGAVGEEGEIFLNQLIISELQITAETQDAVISRERAEVRDRQRKFRGSRKPPDISGRCIIIVDDGIATGATIEVACLVARKRGVAEVIVAAPVASQESAKRLSFLADKSVILQIPEDFSSVGQWYEDFTPTTDEDVIRILQTAWKDHGN